MRCLHFVIPLAVALGASVAPLPAAAQIGLNLSVTVAPPELPVYVQPPLPAPGYIFTPGYWAYGEAGYFWVPGTWVEPPQPGLLWTPGYWGWNSGHYLFNAGYWGATVGFYGGINYGFGYGGIGFEGGYWRGGSFFYNSRVNNFGSVHVTNVFERNVTNVTSTHVSFNGPGGINRQPTPEERTAMNQRHIPPVEAQNRQVEAARQNRSLLASENHGHPSITATPRPGDFSGAHGGEAARAGSAAHPGAVSPHPVARGQAPHGTRAAQPHQVAREGAGHEAAPREGTARTHEAAPREAVARPERAAAPRPERAAAPRPERAAAPRPERAAAPRPAPHPTARPAGRGDEKKHG